MDVAFAHTSIDADGVEEFADFLLAPERRLPVIAFTARDDEVLDAESFLVDNVGVAHVVLIRAAASWGLSERLPPGHGVYGGAVRIWWPGLSKESSKWDHPLWTSDRSAKLVYRQVAEQIRRVALARAPRDHRHVDLETARRAAEMARLREEVEAGAQLLDEASESPTPELRRQLSEAMALLDIAEEERREAKAHAEEAERRAQLAVQEARELRSEIESYWRQVESYLPDHSTTDPDRQIDAFVRTVRGHLEEVRDPRLVREFRFGPHFFERLEAHGPAYTKKAAKTCAAVASGDPARLKQVEDHPLRTGEKASRQTRIRQSDGAVARRRTSSTTRRRLGGCTTGCSRTAAWSSPP